MHLEGAGGVARAIRPRNERSIAPAGGVHSTAADMARWLRFQLGGGQLDGRRVVSERVMAEMHHPWTIIPTTPQMRAARQVETCGGYGLGWQVMDYRGHAMLWHSGNADGMPSYMAILPKDRIGVVVMLNSWGAAFLHGDIAARVLDTLLGLPTRDYSGENLARIRAQPAPATGGGMGAQIPNTRPTLALDTYTGVYADSLHGDFTVAREGEGLTLKMARGEVADLHHWHHDTFHVQWRDELFGEYFGTMLTFALDAQPVVVGMSMRLNRDEITARRKAGPN